MDRLMKVREVAALLAVSRHTIYKWIKYGKINYVVLPSGRIRIPESEVQRLIKKEGGEDSDNNN